MVPQLGNVRLKNTCQGPSSDQHFSCCWDLQALLSELQTRTWKEHCKEPSRNQHNPQEVEKGPKSVNGIQYSQVQRDAQSTAKNRAKYRSFFKKKNNNNHKSTQMHKSKWKLQDKQGYHRKGCQGYNAHKLSQYCDNCCKKKASEIWSLSKTEANT